MKDQNLTEITGLISQAEKDKLGWGIKFTKKNSCCFSCEKDGYSKVKYIVGKVSEVKNTDISDKECSAGIHLGKSFIGAGNYNIPEKIFFCTFNKKDLYGQGDDKWRVSKCLVVKELPQWLGYGLHGKEVLKKLGKKVTKSQIAKYNPYQATKLPSIEDIASKIPDQVGDQVWNQVRDQVWNQVRDQVGDQVWNQVRDQVWNQVGDQVWNQVGDQVWNQVGDQVWNQVGATSYWAVNVYFELNISHWFFDFLKLGIMIVFVQDKAKIFGKKGKYLGEYDQKDIFKR